MTPAPLTMPGHILIVEDEKHLGVGIKYNLQAEGYRVTLVEDGATALRLINADRTAFDLIVLDLMLPGMSGYTVCETIRDGGLNTPVLMLSARTLAEDRTRGFDAGASQYLSKPFDLDELLSRIKNLLSSRLPSFPSGPRDTRPKNDVKEARFGLVDVNFESHEVRVDGKSMRMTPKELRLLKYFLDHEDRVISRQELLSEVWEISGNLQTRSVDNFIARLRKIIEVDSAAPMHLLTIRDAGYRFVAEPSKALGQSSAGDDNPHSESDGDGSSSVDDSVQNPMGGNTVLEHRTNERGTDERGTYEDVADDDGADDDVADARGAAETGTDGEDGQGNVRK